MREHRLHTTSASGVWGLKSPRSMVQSAMGLFFLLAFYPCPSFVNAFSRSSSSTAVSFVTTRTKTPNANMMIHNSPPQHGQRQWWTVVPQAFIIKDTTNANEEFIVQDGNGKEITLGASVRVCVPGLQHFQIAPRGRGWYNEAKEFVLDETDTPAGLKHFALPVGLRGTVIKIFDEREVSANFPVVVKFVPGMQTEEGYDPPVMFSMHLSPTEIEVL